MKCFHPIFIDNPEWLLYEQKHLAPPFGCDRKISVPCGTCEACIYNSAQEWRVRLEEELSCSSSAYFVTLTYNADSLPIGVHTNSFGDEFIAPYVSKRDIQLFLKRLRFSLSDKFDFQGLRYYLVSEYGPATLRPHYHGILFNIPKLNPNCDKNLAKVTELINESWANGFIKVDKVVPERIGYVTKYLSCINDLPDGWTRPFRLMSRHPGIGSSYMDKLARIDWHRENLNCYVPNGKYRRRMPRFYKDKIFDDAMKHDIKEQAIIREKEEKFDLIRKAQEVGMHPVEYYHKLMDKYKRNFNNKYVKKRKDI